MVGACARAGRRRSISGPHLDLYARSGRKVDLKVIARRRDQPVGGEVRPERRRAVAPP